MFDSFNRRINYLRVSVTDRCNLRCKYCMPAEGITLLRHEDILSFDEIRDVVTAAVSMGIDKVRLTGGEPLVRKGIVGLVRMIAAINGIRDLSMTTNGILMPLFARDLKTAGLMRVNISLDTTDPDQYRDITRGGEVEQVFRGIQAAREAGLEPVKLNCVVHHSSAEINAVLVRKFAEQQDLQVRFIREMDLSSGQFSVVEGGDGGHCALCNRLRLTANGYVKPCLFNTLGYSVRELGARRALEMALANKPECGTVNEQGNFYEIGG
jgi:cyclic pyranopterin phosphate synthase